jgi:hypothetical protein
MRFIDREALSQKKRRLRLIRKCEASVLDGAVSCFAEASALHAKAETIYGKCVDFLKVDGVMRKIIAEIFENNV